MTRASELGPQVEIDGTYRIVEKLGEGGMGAVYVAELLRLPKRVALKVLHFAADEGAKARFRREAEIAAKVRHPRIVEVLDYNFLDDGSPYLVMELLEGHDLRHRLASGPLSPAQALPILRDVASALERLHAEGIVHRDLKPENIFLATEGDEIRAKVLDFGISKVVGGSTSLTAEQSVLGTPAYMAPEQVTGENDALDARTDQFALATVAFEMLSGRPAFRGEHVMQLFHQILTAPAPSLHPDGMPSPADPIFARALSKDRAERYLSVSAFVLALSEAYGVAILRPSVVDSLGATAALPAITHAPTLAAGSIEAASKPGSTKGRALSLVFSLAMVATAIAAWALWPEGPASMVEGVVSPPEEAAGAAVEPAADDVTAQGQDAIDEVAKADEASEDEATGDEAPVATRRPSGTTAPRSPSATGTTSTESPSTTPPSTEGITTMRAATQKSARPSDDGALSRLVQAESALAAGDAQGAMRHARASIGKEPSDAARAVLVKAACELRDLGLAKAMARGLRGQALRDAKQHCAASGIKL